MKFETWHQRQNRRPRNCRREREDWKQNAKIKKSKMRAMTVDRSQGATNSKQKPDKESRKGETQDIMPKAGKRSEAKYKTVKQEDKR